MANKKKKTSTVNNKKYSKIRIKKSVKELAIFLVILLVLGLIFMNFVFTLIMILGVILILWL